MQSQNLNAVDQSIAWLHCRVQFTATPNNSDPNSAREIILGRTQNKTDFRAQPLPGIGMVQPVSDSLHVAIQFGRFHAGYIALH